MKKSLNMEAHDSLKEDRQEKSKKRRELWTKILRVFLMIARWPALFIALPVAAFFIAYLASGGGADFQIDILKDQVLLASVLGLMAGTIAAGFIGGLINKNFLSTTGLASLTYIVISFFIRKKVEYESFDPYSENVSFENMKLIVVIALILLVLIGDLLALVIRMLKERMEMRKQLYQDK